jgi:hypothetical protein
MSVELYDEMELRSRMKRMSVSERVFFLHAAKIDRFEFDEITEGRKQIGDRVATVLGFERVSRWVRK